MSSAPPPSPRHAAPGPAAKVVLVLDDHVALREELAEYFGSMGYQVMQAGDGPSLSAALRQHRPDLAVLDIDLPGWNGIEIAQAMHRRDPSVRIILMTGNPTWVTPALSTTSGAFALVEKPIDLARLSRVVKAALL
ncbi:response regulator [Zavarzinia sp.]|uniref:response regulator n=1 Tax=Zavarzinia sp. TaxID=2027920 RepID=UPI003BB4A4EA